MNAQMKGNHDRQATVMEARLVSGDENSSSQMSMHPPFLLSEPLAIEHKRSRSTVKCYSVQSPKTLSGSRIQWSENWVLEVVAFRNTGESWDKRMINWKGQGGKWLYSPGRTQKKTKKNSGKSVLRARFKHGTSRIQVKYFWAEPSNNKLLRKVINSMSSIWKTRSLVADENHGGMCGSTRAESFMLHLMMVTCGSHKNRFQYRWSQDYIVYM
jgi:hypothetical protein